MARYFKGLMAAVVLAAPLALAESKAECESGCDEAATICEETIVKKLGEGKDKKAAVGQAKKICSDAAKHCKKDCK